MQVILRHAHDTRHRAFVMLLAPLFFLSSCAIFPETNVEHLAASAGFKREMVRGDTFLHVAYFNQAPRGAGPLHVYLEGDGSPWIDERWISADPTPRNPLMLSLMALDNAPSVYLGRPCYFGLAETVPCSPRFWTSARYSDSVVTSMQAALKRILDDGHFPDVVLIGHSGGGTLAMLLAERISQTRAVVTIAGNLDTDAWTAFHHYSPLADSLNPARQPPLPRDVYQLHLIGGRDRDVTPALIRPVVARQNSTDLKIIEEYDHVCCWLEMWPEVLATLESHTRSASPRTASAKSRH